MIDPMVSLAFSVYSNPGVYALLLGSGVSKAAEIPTGWEIVLDLIDKVARLQGEEPEPTPEAWYLQKFGEEPEYAKLLEHLAATRSERSAVLRPYFEPTDEEQEQRLKMPTAAHKAIASLVKGGYIRMILTTNFDRLLEIALGAQGVTPDVISTDDALEGAMPYVHSQCTIVKLHGDYKDTRIKNTPAELEQYSQALNEYLASVFDEFGLIVCGWSAEWDTALRDAILQCRTRRFTTYWTVRGAPTDEAERLVQHRRAQTIPIQDADSFFVDLSEKVEALARLGAPHPSSVPIAIERTKKYLVEDRFRIQLYDLIKSETESLYHTLATSRFNPYVEQDREQEYKHRLEEYESLGKVLANILITVAWFDPGIHSKLITTAVERVANRPVKSPSQKDLRHLLWYPALLLIYGVGISAVSTEHYGHLRAALIDAQVQSPYKREPACSVLNPPRVFEDWFKTIVGPTNAYTPQNERIFSTCRPWFAQHLAEDKRYERMFDLFEYLLGLIYWDQVGHEWGPIGCFHWRYPHRPEDNPIPDFVQKGLAQGNDWPLLKEGFFGGSAGRLESSHEAYEQYLGRHVWE